MAEREGGTDIAALIDELIAREGGFGHHRADRGGATRWGITEAVARRHGYAGPMATLPRSVAATLYRADYWTAPGWAAVAKRMPALAAELFDTGVNMGPAVAATFLQRALNALNRNASDFADIAVDGRVGRQTLTALDAFAATRPAGEAVLLKAVEALQGARYLQLAEARPANEAFLYGWLANRIG